MLRRLILLALLASACGVELPVAPGTVITCTTSNQCPDDYACNAEVGRCVSAADSGPLEVSEVVATSSFRVVVTFTKPLDDASASDVIHYAIAPGIGIDGARLSEDRRAVTLFTTELKARTYELRVGGLIDVFGYPLTDTAVEFPGIGDLVDPTAPRLIAPRDTANVTNGTTVELQWTPTRNARAYYVTVALDAAFTVLHPASPSIGYFTTSEPQLELPIAPERAYFWHVTSDVNEGRSAIGRFATVQQEIFVNCPPTADCTAGPEAPQWEAGTRESPFYSPARAVDVAGRIGTTTVKVASRGDGVYPGGLVLRQTVRLSGGWDSTFTVRNRAANPTRLSSSTHVIQVIDNKRNPVTIEGFVIAASSTGVMLAKCDEMVTLRDTVIAMSAGGEALAIDTSGVMAEGDPDLPGIPDELRGPVVTDCELQGSVSVRGNARPVFRNDLFKPSLADKSGAVLDYNGSLLGVVEHSYFEDVGIHAFVGLLPADLRITDSVISTSTQRAVDVDDLREGTLFLANNLILTRNDLQVGVDQNTAIKVIGNRTAVTLQMVHNTIVTRGDIATANVVELVETDAVLTNNLLICTGSDPGSAILLDSDFQTLASVQNNAFVGCAHAITHLLDAPFTVRYDSEEELDGLDGDGVTGSRFEDNVVSTLTVSETLQNSGGDDNNVITLSIDGVVENDWRLRLDPVGGALRDAQLRIAAGGKVTYNEDCGTYDAGIACGAIATDREDVVRTNPPSIGAYERAR